MAAGKRQTNTYWVTKQVPDHKYDWEIGLRNAKYSQRTLGLSPLTNMVVLNLCVSFCELQLFCGVTLRLRPGDFSSRIGNKSTSAGEILSRNRCRRRIDQRICRSGQEEFESGLV
jgi:hypothetical protein